MLRCTGSRFARHPAAALRLSSCFASMSMIGCTATPSSTIVMARRFTSTTFTTDADRTNLKDREEAAKTAGATRSSAAASSSAEEDTYNADGGGMEKDADGKMSYYNPWEVLGLKPGASPHDIRLRYHELLQECHPEYVKNGAQPDVIRLNQVNKAYEIVTKSPTLDKRYRNLVSDTQRMYYRLLPEWIAKNVDEQPRYISWVRWRVPSPIQIFLLVFGMYAMGRFYVHFPVFTIVFFSCVACDYLFHTMSAPFALSMLFLSAVVSNQTYTMAWLVSPRSMLQGELGY